jgi:multidrug efflux pump subunit AcrA (membrane-fusion protein)
MKNSLTGGHAAIFYTILIVAAGLFMLSCSTGRSADNGRGRNANAENAEPVVTITAAKAELRDVPMTIQSTGSVTAQETSDVAPKVAGKVVNVMADVGDFVRGGSAIAQIDDTTARQQLATARAGVKQANAAVRQAEARLGLSPGGSFNSSNIPEVRAAAANYQQALAEQRQAESNEARYRDLVESGDVAMITYEQYRTARDTARARANSAKQSLDAAINAAKQNNQAIASAQAGVEAAQNQVQIAQQAIADTTVRAPFSGYVSARPVAVGEYVSSASIVATVLRTNPIKVQVQVSEADVPYITVGRGVSLTVDAYPDRKFAGVVSAVNPAVDPNSRSATIEAAIENPDNALRSGMFATLTINREGGTKAVFVPKTAVYNDPATRSSRVFVIQDGVARLKVVQLGVEENDQIQIMTGLEGGEMVATSAVDQLYEGARVAF